MLLLVTAKLTGQSSVTLEEIENVHDFVWKLEKIELPNQLVAVIGDPLLQKLLQLRSQESGAKRVDHWLMAFFEDQLHSTDENDAAILEMLLSILNYTRSTKARYQIKRSHYCSNANNSRIYL